MDSRSKQVYFIPMYIRYVLDIHSCFKLARQTYFDMSIHEFLGKSDFLLEKIKFDKNTSFGFW